MSAAPESLLESADAIIEVNKRAYDRLCNMASTVGWWICPGGLDAETGAINVHIYPERGTPSLETVRQRLASPRSPSEAIGVFQMTDCAVLEPIVFYVGNVGGSLERVIRSLPKFKRSQRR